jgi:hypothetical protein
MALKKTPKVGLKSGSTVKVELHSSCKKTMEGTDPYATNQFRFSPCSKIVKGTTKQLCSLIGCREGYVGSIKRHYNGENPMPDYSTEKTTIMAYANPGSQTKQYEQWVKNIVDTSVALVNHFEDMCGWAKTKAFKAELDVKSKGIVYVFQGSRWWSTAPSTLSLYLLLIRLGRREELQKLGKNFSTATLLKTLEKLEGDGKSDGYYIQQVRKWPILLKNRAKIFSKRKFSTNFVEGASHDGIKRITNNEIQDNLIQTRFNNILGG